MFPFVQRPEIVMGQQAGALRQGFYQQHAGKTGEVSVAAPERRLIGGDVLDGAQPPFGNAGAGGQHAIDQQAGITMRQNRLNIVELQGVTIQWHGGA